MGKSLKRSVRKRPLPPFLAQGRTFNPLFLRTSVLCRLSSVGCKTSFCTRPDGSSTSGQTTVEYLLAIGVIGVAMAAVLLTGGLFEALADLFNQIAGRIALPVP